MRKCPPLSCRDRGWMRGCGRAFNRIPDFGYKCSQNQTSPHYGSKASSLSDAVSNSGQSGLIPSPFWVSQQMWYDRGEKRRGWMEALRLAHHPTLDRRRPAWREHPLVSVYRCWCGKSPSNRWRRTTHHDTVCRCSGVTRDEEIAHEEILLP